MPTKLSALIALVLPLIAYSDEPLEKRIIGTWAQQQGFDRIAFQFLADHKGVLITPVTPGEFTWFVKDNKVYLAGKDGKPALEFIAGTKPDEMQWRGIDAEDKKYETLKRVGPPSKPDAK